METAVLRSNDPLKNRLHLDFYGYRDPCRKVKEVGDLMTPPTMTNPSSSPNRKKTSTRTRSKPNTTRSARKCAPPTGKENDISKSRPLVMGQVTILKRGEELTKKKPDPPSPAFDLKSDGPDSSSIVFSTNRLGPDPVKITADLKTIFAGPVCFTSPSPSDVPLPGFLTRGGASELAATKGLRCLLRLDAVGFRSDG